MRKLAAAVYLASFGLFASAATLEVEDGVLMGAGGVDVNGILYDVRFENGSCIELYSGCDEATDFAFQTLEDANLASSALFSQVLIGIFDHEYWRSNSCFVTGSNCYHLTPYGVDNTSPNTKGLWSIADNHAEENRDWVTQGDDWTFVDYSNYDGFTFAVWTLSDVPHVSINAPGGDIQECSERGGATVELVASTRVAAGDRVVRVDWTVNDIWVANGINVDVFIPLGQNSIEATLLTANADTYTDHKELVIEDSLPPLISSAFIDPKSGAELSQARSNQELLATFQASDICDPGPTISSTAGLGIQSGDILKPKASPKDGAVSVIIEGSRKSPIQMTVTSVDSSNNLAEKIVSIEVVK
jgi:hypothetical protein